MKHIELPAADRLHELFFYDECDGELYLRVDRGPRKAGMLAGGINVDGYVSVAIDGRRYLAHRIIWKMKTGGDAVLDIDHEDNNRNNNRFENLREATKGQNLRNSKISRRNKSGTKGVYFNPLNNNWRVSIMVDRVPHRLGSFADIEEAKAVAHAARERLHGKFSRAA